MRMARLYPRLHPRAPPTGGVRGVHRRAPPKTRLGRLRCGIYSGRNVRHAGESIPMTRDASVPDDTPPPADGPGDSMSDVLACYRRDVDRTLLRLQLAKTPEQRLRDVMRLQQAVEELRRAGREARRRG